MEKYRVDLPMRMFLLTVSAVLWLGIWLTGFNVVSWVLYLPAAFFLIAAVSGICPGLIITRMPFGNKAE